MRYLIAFPEMNKLRQGILTYIVDFLMHWLQKERILIRICRLWYHFEAIGKPYHPHGPMNFLTDPPFSSRVPKSVFASPNCVLTDFNG